LLEVLDLAVLQIDLDRTDLARDVPGAVLMGDENDPLRTVRLDESLEAAAEEVEVLGEQVQQGQRLDASRDRHEVAVGPHAQVHRCELEQVRAPAPVHARDDHGVRPRGVPGECAGPGFWGAHAPPAFFSASAAAASVLAWTSRATSMPNWSLSISIMAL